MITFLRTIIKRIQTSNRPPSTGPPTPVRNDARLLSAKNEIAAFVSDFLYRQDGKRMKLLF